MYNANPSHELIFEAILTAMKVKCQIYKGTLYILRNNH